MRDWASVAARGRLLLSGSVAHASLKTAVDVSNNQPIVTLWELAAEFAISHRVRCTAVSGAIFVCTVSFSLLPAPTSNRCVTVSE